MGLNELFENVKDLNIRLINTKTLIFEGKYVQADQRLQGALRKCEAILQMIVEIDKENKPLPKDPGPESVVGPPIHIVNGIETNVV